MADTSNKKGKQVAAAWKADDLDNWKSHWQDVAELCHRLESWIDIDRKEGSEHIVRMNGIGEEALGTFTDGFVGSTMPKTEQWAEFEPISKLDEQGKETKPSQQAKRDWGIASKRFMKTLADSNFYEAIHETTKDGGAFGNGCPGVFQGKTSRLNFMNVAPANFCFDEDSEQRPGTVRRIFKYTAQQIKELFDEKKKLFDGDYVGGFPECLQKVIDGKDAEKKNEKHKVLEEIEEEKDPQDLPESGKTGWRNRRFQGSFVLLDKELHFFSTGYYENPWAPWRLEKGSQEKLGRGFGMKALEDLRGIQKMQAEYIISLEKNNDPGWLAHAESDLKEDNRAGGVSIADWDRQDQKPERNPLNAGIRELKQDITEQENKIRAIFFNDIFKLFLREDIASKEFKAAQVDAMMDEKLPLMVGVSGRFLNECLKPLLRRSFMILLRQGMFEDLNLGNVDLFRIEFRSRIAMAIKTLESRGILQVLNAIAMVAPYDPMAILKIDIAGMLGRLAENSTAPSEFVRTEVEYNEEVRKLQEQQAIQQAAAVAKDVGAASSGLS